MSEQQLSLDLPIKQDASLSDFTSRVGRRLLMSCGSYMLDYYSSYISMAGQTPAKTHLLSAICESFRDSGQSVIYLSLRELIHADPSVLSALESMQVIAVDDIDRIQGSHQWQEAIFHLINLSNEYNNVLIFAGRLPVVSWIFRSKIYCRV